MTSSVDADDPPQPDRLAVYGTLVPDGVNAHVLEGVTGQWTRGTVAGIRHDDGWHGYPGVVLDAASRVAVHVLHAPDLAEHLPRLDAFEGTGYRRVVAPVVLEDGREVDAWIYVLADPPA